MAWQPFTMAQDQEFTVMQVGDPGGRVYFEGSVEDEEQARLFARRLSGNGDHFAIRRFGLPYQAYINGNSTPEN